MTPLFRYHSVILSATITVMYSAFASAPTILGAGKTSSGVGIVLGLLLGLLLSLFIYKITSMLLNTSMIHFYFIKRLVLGNECMHGTWIGVFIGNNSDKRIYVEHFEQDLESLIIRGTGYTESGELFAQWISEPVNINNKKGKLVYTYTSDVIYRQETSQGLGVFQFVRLNMNRPPIELKGYVVDLDKGKRLKSEETKISPDLLPPDKALDMARKMPNFVL